MKNSEIHKGLPEENLREYLGMQLVELYGKSILNKKESIPYNKKEPFEWGIRNSELEIEFLQRDIIIRKNISAVLRIISMNGWNEFDVSDHVEKDVDGWMSFIGTEKEHSELMSLLQEK
jgi:hypothetical protein